MQCRAFVARDAPCSPSQVFTNGFQARIARLAVGAFVETVDSYSYPKSEAEAEALYELEAASRHQSLADDSPTHQTKAAEPARPLPQVAFFPVEILPEAFVLFDVLPNHGQF